MSGQIGSQDAIIRAFSIWLMAAVLACGLVAVLLFVWVDTDQQRVPYLNVQVLPEELSAAEVAPDTALARPLFWAERRPVEPVAETVQAVPEAPLQELTGVRLLGILAKGNHYTALLEVDGKVERVTQDATVKEWNVADITAREVHFSSREGGSVLSLERELHQSIKLER